MFYSRYSEEKINRHLVVSISVLHTTKFTVNLKGVHTEIVKNDILLNVFEERTKVLPVFA